MMKQMRENTKIILWIVVVAFVITIFAVWGLDLQTGGTGGPQQNLVGRINGVDITPQLFQSVYSQLSQQYRTNSPDGSLSYAQQEMLREQAWENIVSNTLTSQEIEKLGITVTDQEILSYLRDAPPPEVRQYFVDDKGNFDYSAYQAALNNPDADWTAVEQLARQRIPVIKLNQYLMSQVHVSRIEIQKAFEEDNTRMLAEYVAFPLAAEDIGDYKPTDDEIKAYYDSHPDEFSHEEKAVIKYVKIPIRASNTDREDIDFTIGVIRDQLKTSDFADLAKTYSEAPTSEVGGDTGYIVRAQRDSTVMSAVDTMSTGEISAPVWTDNGVYVVQLVGTKEEDGQKKYRLNEIFLKLSPGSTTTDSLFALADTLRKEAATDEGSLEAAGKARGVTIATTPEFTANSPIEGIGFVPAISRFAFSSDAGAVSNVLGDDNNYYVCEVVKRIPAGPRPLEEVRDGVVQALLQERRRLAAEHKADGFFRKLRSGTAFDEAAKLYGYTVAKTDTFTVRMPVAGQPPRSPFAYAAFDINADDMSVPVESGGSIYVIHLLYRTKMDDAKFAQQADAIRQRLQQSKAQAYIAYWYDQLRKKAKIEDFRTNA